MELFSHCPLINSKYEIQIKIEKLLIKMGFKSREEYDQIVAKLDLSTSDKLTALKDWQLRNGTKEELLKLSQKERL